MIARLSRWTSPLIGLVVFFGLWEGLLLAFGVKAFILPRPSRILSALNADPSFFAREALVTGREAIIGLVAALALAFVLAVPMARWRSVERAVEPVATLIQVIPIVVYAPAFVIWLGFGQLPIVAVIMLIGLVPLLFNMVAGFRTADPAGIELLQSVGASRWEILRTLQAPSAVPSLFAGLRIAVGLSLVGAVLGEWYAGVSHGLGYQIQKGANQNSAPLVWASAFSLGVLGGLTLLVLALLERRIPGGKPKE
jgi:ABC-type nitrate/sulfonate/bicarbonate transport system permease component